MSEQTPEPLVDNSKIEEIQESIKNIKEQLETVTQLNETVSKHSKRFDKIKDGLKASNNALQISNLTDILTEKFETLSNSIDTRLAFFHPEGPDAEGLSSLCDYNSLIS